MTRRKTLCVGFHRLAVILTVLYTAGCNAAGGPAVRDKEETMEIQLVKIPSSLDGAEQPVNYLRARGKNRPLLVALHTWSFDYTQPDAQEYFTRCFERDWNCIFPDFRGPNRTPPAGGSEAALRDIIDAVDWATENLSIDPRRIFLAGASGGGHMALLSAGTSPSRWTAVSAWVPITGLARWHRESLERTPKYAGDLEGVCGGPPGSSAEVDAEYEKRSPLTHIWRANIVPLDINAGIHDGHAGELGGELGGEGSVPVGHSIRAYNEVAGALRKSSEIIPEEVIDAIERDETVPTEYGEPFDDPVYGRIIHLRRTTSMARLTLFEGGHEIIYDAVFAWFEGF